MDSRNAINDGCIGSFVAGLIESRLRHGLDVSDAQVSTKTFVVIYGWPFGWSDCDQVSRTNALTASQAVRGSFDARRTVLDVEPLECRALLSGLSASLTTDQPVYQVGEPIEMTFTMTNTSDAPASVVYGPSFDGFIATQGGQTVWQSNAGINPMFAVLETLQPGTSFTLHATWSGTTVNGLTSVTTTGQFVVTNQLDSTGASATFTIESPLSFSLSASQSVVEVGQSIGFAYSITNTSNQPVTFNMAPTSFIVTNNGGTVWESGSGASSPAPTSETLQPGQSVTQTATWNGVANQGTLAGTNVLGGFRRCRRGLAHDGKRGISDRESAVSVGDNRSNELSAR